MISTRPLIPKANESNSVLGLGSFPIIKLLKNKVETLNPERFVRFGLDSGLCLEAKSLLGLEAQLVLPIGNRKFPVIRPDFNVQIMTNFSDFGPKLREIHSEGLKILGSFSPPWIFNLYGMFQTSVVPIKHHKSGRSHRRGFSSFDHLGVIFTTFEDRLVQPEELAPWIYANDLSHELGHQVLMLFQSLDPIISENPDTPVYSSIRRTDRPAIMSLHAVFAGAYMASFLKEGFRFSGPNSVPGKFCLSSVSKISDHQRLSILSLEMKVRFTELGQKILNDLKSFQEETEKFLAPFRETLSSGEVDYFNLPEFFGRA